MAQLRRLPPGTLPPVVLKFDASSLPVCLITLKGEGLNETQLHDLGQFDVRNQIAGVPGALELSEDLVCLHAPLRSRNELEKMAANASRAWDESPDPGTSWQHKRWGRLAAEGGLAAEWAANSQRRGNLDLMGRKRPLVFDPLLCDLVAPWLPLRQRLFMQLARLQGRSSLTPELDL